MRLLLPCLAATAALTLLAGCGSDAEEVRTPVDGEIGTLQSTDCPDILGPDVIEALGWSGAGEVRFEDPESCVVEADEGSVTLSRSPVPAVGGEDLPEQARSIFEERCEFAGASADETPEWYDVAEGASACAEVQSGAHRTSTLVLLTAGDAVLELRVDADEQTPADDLESGLATAGGAAEATFESAG